MKIEFAFAFLLWCSISVAYSADEINGRVVNSSSTGLSSARVWLKNNPSVIDSTDTDGKFSIPFASTAVNHNLQTKSEIVFCQIQNNHLIISLTSSQQVSAIVFNTNGKLIATLCNGIKNTGTHILNFEKTPVLLTSGSYIIKVTSNGFNFETKLINTNGKLSVNSRIKTSSEISYKSIAKLSASPDTLIVLRMGYEIKKIPLSQITALDAGTISLSLRTYKLEATTTVKQGRTIEVILPSDYKELYALPVLYLLHGGGEDHTAWRTKGTLINTLNSFSNREKMQAMIIVTPDAASSSRYGDYGRAGDAFYTDLTVDIRKYVELHYKADTTRFSRAISGFSMGAMQTHNLTLFYPELFGYSYPICGGLYKCAGFSEDKFKADIASGAIDTTLIHSMKAYRLHSNETDIAWTDTRDFEKFLTTTKIKHTYDFTSYSIGGHTFSYCNAVFQNYADEIFKN